MTKDETRSILAIDLGTSAIKFLRTDARLRVLQLDRVPLSGLDVAAWMEALRSNILAHGDGDHIDRIAITGQMHGLVPLEPDGYGAGVPWTDQRGADILSDLNARLGRDQHIRTGGPLVSGFQAVSLARMKAHERDRWSRIRKTMLPKDALIHALTRAHVTDPSDAAGTGMFDISMSDWAWDIVDAIGIKREWLPRIVPTGSSVGMIDPDIASTLGLRDSVKVVIAGGDAPVGAYGAGVTHTGDALILLSSGAQIILPTPTYAPDPAGRWYTWPAATSADSTTAPYSRAGTLLNAGNTVSWLGDILRDQNPITPSPTRLIALPHLIGERTPVQDPRIRGALLGLTPETTAPEVNRAMMEGIAYGLRHALENMCEQTPTPQTIRIGGGGANIAGLQEIITNVLNIPTQRIASTELSALGTAALAIGKASTPDLEPAIMPDPDLVVSYDERYALYRETLKATQSLFYSINELDGGPV